MYVRQERRPPADPDRPGPERRSARRLARDRRVRGASIAGVLSPFLTVEEAYLMASYLKGLSPANVLALGPVPARGEDLTFTPDQTKGRTGDTSFVVPRPFTIHAEKCPNRRGVEAVLEHFQGEVIGFGDFVGRVGPGEFQAALRRLRRDRPVDRRGAGEGDPRQGRVPRGPGHARSRRWRKRPTSCWPGRPSPRRRAATSTPTAGSSTPRRPCPPRRVAARPRHASRSCWAGRRGPVRSRDVLAELAANDPGLRRRPRGAGSPRSASRSPSRKPSGRRRASSSPTPGRARATTRATGRASRARRAGRTLEFRLPWLDDQGGRTR